jgi:hypothetical protein
MQYRILLISIIIIVLPLRAVQAQDSRYRVEVLVLTHLGHDQQPREMRKLEDLSNALDFLTPPPDSAEDEEPATESDPAMEIDHAVAAAPAELQQDAMLGPGGEELVSAEEEPEEDPLDLVVHVEEMGPEMQEAWRRLRLSAPVRPLQYLAWEQGSREPFPVLRIHDLEAVLVEDPWAEQRLELENPEESPEESLVFGAGSMALSAWFADGSCTCPWPSNGASRFSRRPSCRCLSTHLPPRPPRWTRTRHP